MSSKENKVSYGFKQFPRAQFEKFHGFILKNGYKQCQVDHTLFVKHQKGKVTTFIVYVDDIIVASDDQ